MALYKLSFSLKDNNFRFIDFGHLLSKHIGYPVDVELLSDDSAVFSDDKTKTAIEVFVCGNGCTLDLYLSPRIKKNYFENAFLYCLTSYVQNAPEVPNSAKKEWKDVTFLEKLFDLAK